MKVYSITPKYDEFKSFVPKDWDEAITHYSSLRCKGSELSWPKPLQVVGDEEDVGIPEPDIGLLNIGSLVFSDSAIENIRGALEKHGQLLPLMYNKRTFYLWNITNVLNALNPNESEFNDHGGVSKAVFSKNAIPRCSVFKIKEDNATSIFCTEDFANMIKENNLSGVDFEEQESI